MFFGLLSLALLTVDHREHHLESVRAVLAAMVSPLQYALGLPLAAGDWVSEALATRQKLEAENASLRDRQLLLEARLQKMAALETENRRLRKLLDSSFKIGERVLIAELMAVDLEPFSQEIVINKGALHGVYEGQPLLDAQGVLGQVIHVSPLSSTAMLITDASHALPVWVDRNGLRAIAVGTGAPDRLELPNLPNNTDIKPGDLLVTSGLGGRFPRGYPVAVVDGVEPDPQQAYARVSARPIARLKRSREVLLVWPARKPPCPANDASCQAGAAGG